MLLSAFKNRDMSRSVSFLLLCCFSLLSAKLHAQAFKAPDGGGEYIPQVHDQLSEEQKARIHEEINRNKELLGLTGHTSAAKEGATTVLFNWPLKQAAGYNYLSYYGVANYVDLNPANPGSVIDWNCGNRTYDVSGYNHGGCDIFLWPFDINMMEDEQVEIIAAADGIIIGKDDGNFDHNCAMGSSDWNAVYVLHNDGKMTWYGHMKTGSTTSLSVGDTVHTGDYLGLVGSSGSSTGPHLHFEVHDALDVVVEPFQGSCNPATSLWASQKPYYESSINTIMTNSPAPVFNACPALHDINRKDTFTCSDVIYFSSYFHDQMVGQNATYTIYYPDNSIYDTWTFAMSDPYYVASWWYWYYTLPSAAPYGAWRYTLDFMGQHAEYTFYVLCGTAPSALPGTNANQSFSLSPNPATEKLQINSVAPIEWISVSDMSGRMMHVLFENNQIDVSGLSAGIYQLQFSNRKGDTERSRFVKN